MKCWNPHCDYDALAPSARNCPECHTERPKRRGKATEDDDLRMTITIHGHEFSAHVCAFVEAGQRCANVGNMSQSTSGSGPHWCHQHFPPFRGYATRRSPPTPSFAAIKAALKFYAPGPTDVRQREPGEEG